MSEFDRKYPNARAISGKPGWPAGVRSISMDGVDYLGVGDDGSLHWDGKLVVTRRGVSLTNWQAIGATIGIGSALAVAIVEWLRFLGFGS